MFQVPVSLREKKPFNTYRYHFLFISYFTRHFNVELKIRPDIRPDIRYPACTGYPVSDFLVWPDIRQNQYPVHPHDISVE
jgi:hypothetical protein